MEFEDIEERIVRLTPNSSRLGDAIINKEATKLYYLSAFEDDYDISCTICARNPPNF